MEIGPISGIRMIPAVKALPTDSRLAAVFDIGDSARAGDETYSGGGKSAGGQDDEEGDALEAAAPESGAQNSDDSQPGSISFFA
ncbi:MAG: hypothetical protein ACRD19_05825 [Terriglobia bacterium]